LPLRDHIEQKNQGLLGVGSGGVTEAGALVNAWGHGGMTRRNSATLATTLCGTVVLGTCVVVSLAGIGSASAEEIQAAAIDPALAARSETPAENIAPGGALILQQIETRNAVSSLETFDECPDPAICIDEYLWAAYQRTPKRDSVREVERKKVTVKKKGKTRTVTKKVSKLVAEDFTWKDQKAADKIGMPLKDYVIGGMDGNFKLKLYHTLRALEEAGLEPGITSAFRDDYRQSLTKGIRAAVGHSYHGGSAHGGYGHGLAADLVSVRGANRTEQCANSDLLWKWIDAHGQEFGVGRPYLDRDPPHVGPIEGREYASHRSKGGTKHASLDRKKRHKLAARDAHKHAKHTKTAKHLKAKGTSPRQADSIGNGLVQRSPRV
jgi:hypothetical protein